MPATVQLILLLTCCACGSQASSLVPTVSQPASAVPSSPVTNRLVTVKPVTTVVTPLVTPIVTAPTLAVARVKSGSDQADEGDLVTVVTPPARPRLFHWSTNSLTNRAQCLFEARFHPESLDLRPGGDYEVLSNQAKLLVVRILDLYFSQSYFEKI